MHYDLVPGINYGFTPSAAPDGVDPQKHFTQGMYAYINSQHDENLRQQSEKIFGQTVPFSGSNDDSLLIGRAVASHTGYRSDPARYMKEKNMPLPPNWSGENSQLYALIGQDFIQKAQEEYAIKQKAAEQFFAEQQPSLPARPTKTEPNDDTPVWAICFAAICAVAIVFTVLIYACLLILRGIRQIKAWLAQWVAACRAQAPVVLNCCTSPESMRLLFLLAVIALIVIAISVLIIACVLLF